MKPKQFSTEEAEEFFRRFYHDGADLRFRVKVRGKSVGDLVGTPCERGYRRVAVLGRKHLVHRVVYFMVTGGQPECVDHIDGDPSNNKLSNLRSATKSQNCHHQVNKEVKGYKINHNGKYQPYVSECGKYKSLGDFETIEEALEVRREYVEGKYGDFA